MNDDQFEGKMDRFKGKIQEKWGQLTDDEIQEAKGSRKNLIGKIQEKYGDAKEDISKQLDAIFS